MKTITSKFSKRSYNRSVKFAAGIILKEGPRATVESCSRIIGEIYGAQWGKAAVRDIKKEMKKVKV